MVTKLHHILINISNTDNGMASLDTIDILEAEIGHQGASEVVINFKQVPKLINQVNDILSIF